MPVRLAHPWGEALSGAPGCEDRYGLSWWSVRPPAVVAEGAWSKNLLDAGLGLLLCLLSAPGFVVCSLLGRPLRLVAVRPLERMGQRRRTVRWSVWDSPMWLPSGPLPLVTMTGGCSASPGRS